MARSDEYEAVIVESFWPSNISGRHGPVHIRPAPGQVYGQEFFVECSKELSNTRRYPVGTKFRIRVKLTDKQGGTPFLYSYHGWPFEVVSEEAFNKQHSPRGRA